MIFMKPLILILTFILSIIDLSQAQSDSIVPDRLYRSWIKPMGNRSLMEGALFDVKDSSILLSNSYKKAKYQNGLYDVSKIDAGSIDVIQLRKNHKKRNGILIAGVTLFIAGLTIGIFTSANAENKGTTFVLTTIPTLAITGIGVGIGALFGSVKKKYTIRGSQQQFDLYKNELDKCAIKYGHDDQSN